MSVLLIQDPPSYSFSADLISAKFSCSNYLQQVGIAAINQIDFSVPGKTAGTIISIKYGSTEIAMVAQVNPDDSGTSFKANAASIAEVAEGFKNNFRLNADFDISISGNYLVFTAKEKSDKFNFSGGGQNTVVGKQDILRPNYSVAVRLFCENAENTGFSLINEASISINLNSNGIVEYPIGDKLHNFISNDIRWLSPDIPQNNAIECKKSCRKYYLEYAERFGSDDVLEKKVFKSSQYTILHGGLSHRAQFSQSLSSLIAPSERENDRFLKQGNTEVYTRTNQPQYLYFFNTRAAVASAVLKAKIYCRDGSETEIDLYTLSLSALRKYGFDVRFEKLLADGSKIVEKYEIWLSSSVGKISEVRTYHLNYQLRSYVRYFLNWSSWGSLDSRLCYGKGNTEFEILQKEAKKILKKGFDIKQGDTTVFDVSIKSNFTVATGWMNRSELILNRDFYLSAIKYRYVGGLLMPIMVTSKTINEIEDGNHLFAQQYEYRYLYDDHAFTEGDVEEPGLGFGDFFFSSNSIGANPTGGFYETDPTVPVWVKQITQEDITKWNSFETLIHIHENFELLNALGYVDGYLLVEGRKIKAAFADNAEHWNYLKQPDYLTQPVRPEDEPKFKGTGSPAFQSGFSGSGWEVKERNGDIHATVDKLTVRKEMSVYELVVNQIRATNGSVWISDAIKILDVTISGSNYNCTIDTDNNRIGVPFVVNDILRCQRWTGRNVKYYVARVTAIGSGTFTLVKLDGAGIPEAGDDVVRMGNATDVNRQGAIYLTASDAQAPYIDVIDQVTSASLMDKTKVRLGKLDGINDPDFGALGGYGLYGQNVYLTDGHFKGVVTVTGGNAATQIYANQQALDAKNLAIAAAELDATSKDNALKTVIQGYADSVALSQANVAKAAAISAASIDAQAKADAARVLAEQMAQQLLDDTGLASRNLIPNSNFSKGTEFWLSADATLNVVSERLRVTAAGTTPLIYMNIPESIPLQDYTLSARVKTNGNGLFEAGIATSGGTQFKWTNQYSGDFSIQEVTHQITTGIVRIYFRMIGATVGNSWFELEWVKLEKGDKRTGWTPSPADVENAIADAEAKAIAAQNAYNTLTGQLKGMAYKDVVALADLGTTVISGGKLTNTLIDTNYIKVNVINVGYINSLEIEATKIKVDGSSQNAKDYIDSAKASAINTAAANAQKLLDDTGIASENLIPNSGFSLGLSGWLGSSVVMSIVNGRLRATVTGATALVYMNIPETRAGEEYTLSARVRTNDNGAFQVGIATTGGAELKWSAGYNGSSFSTQTVTHQITAGTVRIYFRLNSGTINSSWFELEWTKLERGSRNTGWSSLKTMAYKDVVALSDLGTTVIQGGKLTNTLIDTNYIKTNVINAAYMETLDIKAKQLRTADAPGKITLNELVNGAHDGLLKFEHPNGVTAVRFGVIDGKAAMVWYNENGEKVWEAGQAGIVYVENVPESWSTARLLSVGSFGEIPTEANKTQMRGVVQGNSCRNSDHQAGAKATMTAYQYNAGKNAQSGSNGQYNGIHTTQVKSTTNWIPNGWYVPAGYLFKALSGDSFMARIEYYVSGKMVKSELLDNIIVPSNASSCPTQF